MAKLTKPIKPLIALIVATVLLILFLTIALLLAPRDYVPEFGITDRKGSWEAQGTIAVFDDTINPGSHGEYQFIIKNETEVDFNYGIILSEYLDAEETVIPFMRYRLKIDGVYIDATDTEWHTIDELRYYNISIMPDDRQRLTLEWDWPFENGMDENDTLLGQTGGKLSLTFFVWAEVV